MRISVTLDSDVARRVKQTMASKGLSLGRVVNEALRTGLASSDKEAARAFRVEPHACRPMPGIELDRLNQLVDELDAQAAVKSLSSDARSGPTDTRLMCSRASKPRASCPSTLSQST